MASQIMMSAVIHGPKKMEQMCVSKGVEKQRVHPQSKKPLEIYQYQYKHQAGINYFYQNNEQNATLQEKLTFTKEAMSNSLKEMYTNLNYYYKLTGPLHNHKNYDK